MAESGAVQGFLFALFSLGKNEDEAFAELKKVVPDDFDISQVIDFYSRMRIGEYDFGKAIQQDMRKGEKVKEEEEEEEEGKMDSDGESRNLHITQLPDHIKRIFLNKLDMRARFSFRRTCSYICEFSDLSTFRMDKLSIYIGPRNLRIFDGTRELTRDYEKIQNGLVLHKGPENAEIVRGNYERLIAEDLRKIFMTPRLVIGKLVIKEMEFDALETDHYQDIFNLICRVLIRVEDRIRVEKVFFNVNTVQDLHSLLPHFEPKHLKEIMIGDDEIDNTFTRLRSIHLLDQWKHAKTFRSRLRYGIHDFVDNYAHFDLVEVRLEQNNFPTDIIMTLKDIYLTRQSFNQMKIDLWRFNPRELDEELMKTPGATRHLLNSWYFKYPDSDEKLILEFTSDRILFKGPEYQLLSEDEDYADESLPFNRLFDAPRPVRLRFVGEDDDDDNADERMARPAERGRIEGRPMGQALGDLVGQMYDGLRRQWH